MGGITVNTVSNRQVICEMLIAKASQDQDIVVLTSDSRGSASLVEFAAKFPDQFVEVGIAEQNIVGMAAGLAACGKKPFVATPASFLSTRSIEQIKVDVAYSNTNVKLIGISGGISYGALGMTHHSVQDIAFVRAIPGIMLVLPADRHETANLIDELVNYEGPVYIRIGRNPVTDVYKSRNYDFKLGKAVDVCEGQDATIIATGETVSIAIAGARILKQRGISCRVLNMHTIKPLDKQAIIKAAQETGCIVTIEEHSVYGGLGAAVAEVIVQHCPVPMQILGIPDEPVIAGTSAEVFQHYGLSKDNVALTVMALLTRKKAR